MGSERVRTGYQTWLLDDHPPEKEAEGMKADDGKQKRQPGLSTGGGILRQDFATDESDQ